MFFKPLFLGLFLLVGVAQAAPLTKDALLSSQWCYQGYSLGYREVLTFDNSGKGQMTKHGMGGAFGPYDFSWNIESDVFTLSDTPSLFSGSNLVRSFDGKEALLLNERKGEEYKIYRCFPE